MNLVETQARAIINAARMPDKRKAALLSQWLKGDAQARFMVAALGKRQKEGALS